MMILNLYPMYLLSMPSNKENIGIIGYGITSIISVLAFAYGNSEIKAFSSFILGSLITYFIQRRLQEDARKSTIRRANISETFIPLQLRFEEIQRELLDPLQEREHTAEDYERNILLNVLGSKQRFILPLKFRTRLYEFKDNLDKYENDLREARMNVSEIINAMFNSEILASGKYTDGIVYRIREDDSWRYPDFKVINNYQGYHRRILFDKPITLGVNPINSTLKKYPEASLENFMIRFESRNTVNGKNDIRIEYLLVVAAFEAYLNGVLDAIGSIDEIVDLRSQNRYLTKESKNILDILDKFIKKHYPVENSLSG
jgi:hypothetical protein